MKNKDLEVIRNKYSGREEDNDPRVLNQDLAVCTGVGSYRKRLSSRKHSE